MWSFYLKKIFKTFLKLNKFKSLSMRKLLALEKIRLCFSRKFKKIPVEKLYDKLQC